MGEDSKAKTHLEKAFKNLQNQISIAEKKIVDAQATLVAFETAKDIVLQEMYYLDKHEKQEKTISEA